MDNNNATYSSSIEIINPQTLFTDGYELSNQTVIESQDYLGSFLPDANNIEFYIYDANKTLIHSDYNFIDYFIDANPYPSSSISKETQKLQINTSQVNLTPEKNIASQGYTNGNMYAVYNFVNLELGSSPTVPYYLAQISSDRTEIRLKSNFISTRRMKLTAVELKQRVNNTSFFDEIYISFGNNEYHIGVNVKYDDSLLDQENNSGPISATNAIGQSSILIKLYDPLPLKYDLLDELYVATKTAESQGYLVNFVNDYLNYDKVVSIKGPNSNLKINEFVNNSSVNQNKDKLLGTKSSGSKDQLLNRLAQTGVKLSPNYSTGSFSEFVNFSSAKEQVINFVEKVSRIQSYEADINTLSFTTSSNPGSVPISESIASLYTKIEDEITAFSGFDYYQYYSTSSDAYPKTGTVFPLQLLATSSTPGSNWITGAETAGDSFDNNNQNWLYYTVPDFIKTNTSNNNYLDYLNMIGQSFDEVWLYTKAVTEKLNTTNELDKGVPLQLADDVITSLGYTGFGNNYNNQDNFIGLIGNDDGIYVPPTGSELINHYIAINGPGGIINYWEDGYSYEDYVESFNNLGFPYPIDKVSKEIFKRLYHNMAYLVKKKGTISGLRQLINIWGIPNTILRINEFGGKNKDEENDYDLWYQRYSYAFSPVPAGTNYASASVRVPYQPLYRNYIHSHNQFRKGVYQGSEIAAVGTITGVNNGASNAYGIDTQFTVTGGGSGGRLFITAAGGNVTKVTLADGYAISTTAGVVTAGSSITITSPVPLQDLSVGTVVTSTTAGTIIPEGTKIVTQVGMTTITLDQDVTLINPSALTFQTDNSSGYSINSVITITGDQINALNDPILGTSATGTATFTITNTNLGIEQIVPDGIGFRFKTTGYPSSSYAGTFDTQSLLIKKSKNNANDADFGIALYYTGSTSGSYSGSTSSEYFDYGEMRLFISGAQADGGTAMSDPIYLPFFDKGWWNVQLQRDKHPIVTKNDENTTYTLYVGNKLYDGADGNQIGFTGSVSINSNQGGILSQSINDAWNSFSTDLAAYGAGTYLGGWGNTLSTNTTGSIGLLQDPSNPGTFNAKGVNRAGKNFSGSFQEFRYYSHDISQSVFHDAVMNPESIEGNFITGSESSFDIVNFRAPLGNELENIFTSSQYLTQYDKQYPSVHPAITGSSPLFITASFFNVAQIPLINNSDLTSSYDICYNVNSSTRTYSNTNVETYFLDQPSIGIRNRVSNKIKYSSNLNFGNTLSPNVSIQQDPPVSQSYTDNINSLEVAFSPTEEVNDDIIQSLGYGSIQEVIADPRFRSSSDDYYPGLRAISDDYFKKYTNRSQIDYLRLIKYFDDSLFKAIKNYVPARTSVSTGIVIKQHMLERNRYREPQMDIVTTQSYAPFNQPLTAKNLELTGSVSTHQLWNPLTQNTYYSSSDIVQVFGGPGGSVNQYNVLEEGGSLFVLESDDLALNKKGLVTAASIFQKGTGYTPGTQTLTTTGGSGDGNLTLSVTANASGNLTGNANVIQSGENYVAGDVVTVVEGANTTATVTINTVTLGVSLFEAVPLEEVNQDIILVDAGTTQAQGTVTIDFGNSVQTVAAGSSNDAHSIQIATINPSSGAQIIKKYCSSTGTTGAIGNTSFTLFNGTGAAADKATQFAAAVNSVNGQGNGALTPTLTAIVDPNDSTQVILTQLYGGTDGNTTVTYGTSIANNFTNGLPLTFNNVQGGNTFAQNTQSNVSTNVTDLTVNVAFNSSGPPFAITAVTLNSSTVNSQKTVGDSFTIAVTAGVSSPGADVATVDTVVRTATNFAGGTSRFSNTFLNVNKSLRTPIYTDYDFTTTPSNVAITIEASSSIRGTIYTNTTIYNGQSDPPGSILLNSDGEKQYLNIHPEEDMYLLISSNPAITIDDYQIILGENILITTALAAQSTSGVPTLLLDTFSNNEIPSVGSVVTGPDIKAGVVTVLGAVTAAGTGYTPGTSVLATTGAGGGNLTLNVTADANGNVTTASLVGGNPGTGYTSGNIVTIVGGDNNATVEITTATALTIIVVFFDPTNNQVIFNENQTVTDNSKITFTETAIPDADTIPVSQQGSWNYNVTTLGIDTTWNDTQEQFYDGAYSGSDFNAGQYYNNQYNPFKKVKPNSTPLLPRAITTNGSGRTIINNPGSITGLTSLGNSIQFDTTGAPSANNVYYVLGITGQEIVPYQIYDVEYDVVFDAVGGGGGNGAKVGMTLQNYDTDPIGSGVPLFNPVSTLITPQIVSDTTNLVAGTGYSINGNVATTATTGTGLTVDILTVDVNGAITSFIIDNPGVPGIVTVLGAVTAAGTGYTPSTTQVLGTTGTEGRNLTLTVTTNSSGNVTAATLLNPGEGYTSGDVVNIVGGDNNATVTITTASGDYLIGETVTITGGGGNATFDVKTLSTVYTNGVPDSALVDNDANVKFSFRYLPPTDENTARNGRYTLGFQFAGGFGGGPTPIKGDITNIKISGSGGIYGETKAPVFLTQQDAGYDNQRDYQNMQNRDAQGNSIAGEPVVLGNVIGGVNTPGVLIDGGLGYNLGLTSATNQSTTSITGTGTGLRVSYTNNSTTGEILTIAIFPVSSTALADNYNVGDIISVAKAPATNLATFKVLQTNGEIHLVENTQSILYNNSDYNPISNNVNTNRSSSNRYILSYGTTQSVPDNFNLVVTQSYFPLSVSGTFPERADVPDSNYTAISSISPRYTGTKLKSLTYNFFTPSGSVGPEVELPIMPVNRSKNPIGFRVANEFLDGSVTSSFSQSLLGQGSTDWEGDSRQYSGSSTIDKHPIYMARFENSYEQLNLYNTYQFNIDQLIEIPRTPIAGQEITPNSITIDGSNENKKVVSSVFEPKREVSISYLNPKTLAVDYSTMTVGNFDILGGSVEFLTVNTNANSRVSSSLKYQYTLGGNPYTSSAFQKNNTIQMVTGSNTRNNPNNEGILTGTPLFTLSPQLNRLNSTQFTLSNIPLTTIGGPGSGAECSAIFSGTLGKIFGTTITITKGGRGYLAGSTIQCTAQDITNLLRNAGIISTVKGVPITATGPLTVKVLSTDILTSLGTVTSNGFLLSGSLTTDDGIGANIGEVGVNIDGSAYTAGANGTYTNLETFSQGGGTGMTVNVTVAASTVTTMAIVNGGSGYSVGDFIGVKEAILIAAGMTTTNGTLTSRALTATDLTGGGTPYLVNFNPAPISSSQATGFALSQTVPTEQQLLIGGPQLAVYHSYNSVVSSSLFEINNIIQENPASSADYIGPRSLLWTTSGSNPNNIENYMIFDPDGSDSIAYQETQTPFLLERGDIIRVEGVLNNITNDISQSTNIIEDFTVEEVEDFFYTSSLAASQQGQGALNGQVVYSSAGNANIIEKGECAQLDIIGTVDLVNGSNVITIDNFTNNNRISIGDQIGSTAAQSFPAGTLVTGIGALPTNFTVSNNCTGATATGVQLSSQQVYTATIGTNQGVTSNNTLANGTGATVTFVGQGTQLPGWGTMTFSGGHGFKVGDIISFNIADGCWDAARWTGDGTTGTITSAQIRLLAPQIDLEFGSNNFTFGVDINATADNDPTGSIAGYNVYSEGEVGFTAPTFVRVTPDPVETLKGLAGGEITKYTIRRQIEADDKIMLKNVNPPSGSTGVKTPSGQGFLIPNDFSEVQKANALNIINQLKAKNAFNKPLEPGITDGGTSISVEGSGSSTIINIP